MIELEKEHGLVSIERLYERFPKSQKEEISKLVAQLQQKSKITSPFENFYKVMNVGTDETTASNELVWETKMPKSAASKKKGAYEFTSENSGNATYQGILKKITDSGNYFVVLEGYTYWIMHGGIARRKMK